MKKLAILSILFISLVFVVPAPALAQTDAGPTPGSFWYRITTTFENVNLFFTFNSEKKAEKALAYAERRLTQAKAAAENENSKAVEIALTDYEAKIVLASESSKKIKDNERAEKLFTSIADNTSKHQEVLSDVLEKVPEEAREAISKAIEVSKRGQEEATQQIAELKGEIEQLRQENADLKAKIDTETLETNPAPASDKKLETERAKWEAEKARLEAEAAKAKAATQEKKTSTKTFPNGAVAEVDENGNILRWIKEAPQQTDTAPAPTTQNQIPTTVQVSSVNITTTINSAKIEWQTDKPVESKIFLSGGGLSSKVYNSESGFSTRHSASISDLLNNTEYSYEIEAISDSAVAKKSGFFKTKQRTVSSLDVEFSHDYGGYYFGSNCQSVSFSVYTEDQVGSFLPGVSVTFTNPETGEKLVATTVESNEGRGKSAVARFSYTPQVRYSPQKTQTVVFSADSISAEKTLTIRETEFEQYPPVITNLDTERWELIEMATTTYPNASHAERLKNRGYTKDTAWFSKRAYNSGGVYMYFDPDTGLCI